MRNTVRQLCHPFQAFPWPVTGLLAGCQLARAVADGDSSNLSEEEMDRLQTARTRFTRCASGEQCDVCECHLREPEPEPEPKRARAIQNQSPSELEPVSVSQSQSQSDAEVALLQGCPARPSRAAGTTRCLCWAGCCTEWAATQQLSRLSGRSAIYKLRCGPLRQQPAARI